MIKAIRAAFVVLAAVATCSTHATVVRFETSLGDIDVNLYDERTPLTVTNFLSYVNSGDYDGTMLHRSARNFVLQGGGFAYEVDQDSNPLIRSVTQRPAVSNEPLLSNARGTIAMAKLGGDPDSATSQWFFNLSNNAGNLDNQNGGFTAFGEVIAGMDVVDQIAGLTPFNLVGAFSNSSALAAVPLQAYSAEDFDARILPDAENFIALSQVTVIDPALNTAASLNPTPTTRSSGSGGSGGSSGGGGGPVPVGLILMCALLGLLRRVSGRR